MEGAKYLSKSVKAAKYLKVGTQLISYGGLAGVAGYNAYKGFQDYEVAKATGGDTLGAKLQIGFSIFGGTICGLAAIGTGHKLSKMIAADHVGAKASKMMAGGAGKGGSKVDFYVTPSGDAVPATGYRYMSSGNSEQALSTGKQYTTYIGFEKYDSAAQARDAFQVADIWSDCKVRGEFDTLQIIDNMYVPTTLGNTTKIPEPFTCSYPGYGKGGIQQFRVDKEVIFRNVKIIGE